MDFLGKFATWMTRIASEVVAESRGPANAAAVAKFSASSPRATTDGLRGAHEWSRAALERSKSDQEQPESDQEPPKTPRH